MRNRAPGVGNGGQFAISKFRDSRVQVKLVVLEKSFKNRRRLARKFGLCKLYDISPDNLGKLLPERARQSSFFP